MKLSKHQVRRFRKSRCKVVIPTREMSPELRAAFDEIRRQGKPGSTAPPLPG